MTDPVSINGVMIHCRHDFIVNVNTLKPYPKNRNKHPEEQIERLAKIIKYQGLRAPIVVDQADGETIVKGHGTLEACKRLGMSGVPIVRQQFDSEEQRYAFVQSDNAIASWSELDFSGINVDLPELGPDFDIDLLGIKDFEIEPADKYGDKDADGVPPVPKETNIKLGDLYQLGSHRLLCGDSTKAEDVEKLMNGEKADMVFTDPPYGIAYQSNAWDSKDKEVVSRRTDRRIEGDENPEVGILAIRLIAEFLSEEAHSYVWCRWDCYPTFLKNVSGLGKTKGVIVWDKSGPGLGDLECSYGDNEWAIHVLRGRKPLTERQNSVWQVNRMKGLQMEHPTQKPVELCERAIINSTKPKELVVDVFLGSGSTLIACEKTNRKCYGMEIDPQYCQVIIDRWEKFTGQKAVKL